MTELAMNEQDANVDLEVKEDLKHWNEKEQALKVLLDEIQNHPNIVEQENFKSALKLLVSSLGE